MVSHTPYRLNLFYNLAAYKKIISKSGVIVLSILLLAEISLFPIILIGVHGQQLLQQQQQQQKVLPEQVIGLKIISHATGQKVPVGELTISGTSTDNASTDCTVYADWNNIKPFQKVIATGPGGVNDYSTWTFTYTQDYHLITNGTNDLTSKLSCVDESNGGTANLTKYYSINIIGLARTTKSATISAEQEQLSEQQQQPLSKVALSQVIKQTAQEVADINPRTNEEYVQQLLIQLAKQTAAQTGSKEEAIEDIRQIALQVRTYPYGTVLQSLGYFAQQLSSESNSNVMQIVQRIIEEKDSSGKNISESLVNIAVQLAVDAKSDKVNQDIRRTARIIAANQPDVSAEKIESIIIKIALQIAQAEGKAKTGQFIYQISSQITQNPNGVLAQAILELIKQIQ
jgi:hypothetical protein